MSARRVNWLAVFAVGVGCWSVASNYELAFTAPWLSGLLAGGVAALAWLSNKQVGLWLAGTAVVLAAAALLTSGAKSLDSLAVTSGACAGVLLGLATRRLWSRVRGSPI